MRTVVFMIVGIVLGVVGARMGKPRKPSSADVMSTNSRSSPRSGTARAQATDSRPLPDNHSVRQRDILPTDSRYNPLALVDEEEPDLTAKEIFEGEPRDPAFAPVMEQRVHSALDTIAHELRLEDKIRNVHIECKTLSCYTTIEVTITDVEQVYDEINGILLGDSQQPGMIRDAGPEHLSAVTIYNIYRPETRDDAYYKMFLAQAMRIPLELSKRKFLKGQPGAE